MVEIAFASGTIELRGVDEAVAARLPPSCRWDPRSACHRAPASAYADVVRLLHRGGVPYEDKARRYPEVEASPRIKREPRPYQQAALEAWKAARGRGVVVLPTGAGKSQVALMAIADRRRATLVVAPTLDLVRQWYDLLRTTFGDPIGLVGGGDHDVQPLTVTTYDSAHLHMEHLGARFGLLIFDECHHLPGPSYAAAARLALAPFRMGLTATPERGPAPRADDEGYVFGGDDGPGGEVSAAPAEAADEEYRELIGPIVYRKDIVDLSGEYLADYEVERLEVSLSAEERAEYDAERGLYRGFLERQGIRVSGPGGWSEFVMRSARSEDGRRAMRAWRRQRALSFCAAAKLDAVDHLLGRHRHDRALLFTQDNATAYAISRRFLLPVITHQTRVRERSEILERFSAGDYGAIVTSKVLNEGVDLPSASVAIVISGSGSIREHVQRLGRILRKKGDKRAVLYELVTVDTGETYTSERRREHVAYR